MSAAPRTLRTGCRSGFIVCVLILGLWLMAPQVCANPLSSADAVAVEYFEQSELPVNVSDATLVRRQNHQELTGRIANRSDEPVSGVVFLLIALNEQGKISGRISWVEKLDLETGELRSVSIRLPKSIAIPRNGKLILGVDEIFGRRSIWIASKVEQALEAFGTGATYTAPKVKRVTNLVDSPNDGEIRILRRP
jgi:hypothetical protein